MKKIYAALLCTAVAGGAMAQAHQARPTMKKAALHSVVATHPTLQNQAARGAALWSDDFSNPANWSMGNSGGHNWVIGNTAPAGSFPIAAINSTTAANGYALYDSDLYCASTDNAWIQNVNPINLVGFPVVALNFEEYYRNFHGQTFVEVSNDGVNFTPIQVNSTVAANNFAGPNPTLVTVPISSVAGNQATVYIRFRYKSAAGCDYAWMVDDASIVAVQGYNLTAVSAATTAFDYFNTTTYDSLPYTIYPVSERRPLGLNMKYTNNGSAAEAATATITTSDGYTASTTTASLAPTDTAHFFAAPPYTPPATPGVYTINYRVSGPNPDTDTTDNKLSNQVEVSDFIFARDEGAMEYLLFDDTLGSAFKAGCGFHTLANEILYSIDAAFYNTSATGVELSAQLLDPNTASFDPLAESTYHTLVASDLSAGGQGNFVRFLFDPPVQLNANTDYLAAIQHFGGAWVKLGTSGTSPAQTSFIYQSSNATWYYTTRTPMVRMNFGNPMGIAATDMHNGIGLGQNYPNPANNGSTRIDFSLDHSAPVTMELRDVSGKLVQTLVNGTMAQGVHHVDVNTENLGAGVYFYTLTTEKNVSTKRMTVVR